MLCRKLGDAGRLFPAGVILPEPALGIEILAPFRLHPERTVLGIHRDRARPGGVDPEADDVLRAESAFSCRL